MSLFPDTAMGWWVLCLLSFYLIVREVLHRRYRRRARNPNERTRTP